MGTVQVTVPEHLEAGDTFMVAMPQPQTSTLPVEGIHLLKMQVSKAKATTSLGMAVRHSDPVPVVREVSGLASSAGIKPGDTIVSVNGKLVADTSHCLRLLRSATGTVTIEVQRGGNSAFQYYPVHGPVYCHDPYYDPFVPLMGGFLLGAVLF